MRLVSTSRVRFSLAIASITLVACAAAHADVTVSSSGTTGPTALQRPDIVPSSPWTLAYDPNTPNTDLTFSGSVVIGSKGLYTQADGITASTNFTWANTAAGGVQLLLPHTPGSNAVLGLGALNSQAVFTPNNVDGSTAGIAHISLAIGARQTSTPNDRGKIAGLLLQNGKYYRTAWTEFVGPSTPPIGSPNILFPNLLAIDFGELTITRLGTDGGNTNFGSNPDFTPAGAPLTLGWVVGYDTSLGTTDVSNRSVINQWSATIKGVSTALVGDFDLDGDRDATDIDLLFAAQQGAAPPANAIYDVNADNTVNSVPNTAGSDADVWVRTLKLTEYGDANLDTHVNFDDLLILAQNYGATSGGWAIGNFDGQAGVAFDDLLVLAQHYGFGGLVAGDNSNFAADWALAQSMVPEPTLLSILIAGSAFGVRRRT